MNAKKSNKQSNRSNKTNNSNKANNSGGDDKNRSGGRRRKSPKKKKADPRAFWGDPQLLPDATEAKATITANPSAVVKSLGRPPLSGQQNASELYFTAVYDRAVNLAAALAAAGDLIEAEDLATDYERG